MTATVEQVPVRLDFVAHAPVYANALSHLDNAATKQLDQVDFDHRLRELVRIRASQLNGCAYCIDMHTKDARAAGETEQRIYALPAWRETPFFTAPERAPLAFTPPLTILAHTHLPSAGSAPGRGGRLRGGACRVPAGRHRRAGQPPGGDQRLERRRGQPPDLGPRALPAVPPLTAAARRFRAAHHGPRPLVLPNVWDAAS